MKKITNLVLIIILEVILSGCTVLEKIEKNRLEKEQQELALMKSYNLGLVNFFESEMKPFLTNKGQLLSTYNFEANRPKYSAKNQFLEISWGNTGFGFYVNSLFFDERKASIAQSILTSKYRDYIEKQGGTVKEEGINKASEIVGNKNCQYGSPLFGYVGDNLDSVFLPFICFKKLLVLSTSSKKRRKARVPLYTVHFRVVDGNMAEKKLLESL